MSPLKLVASLAIATLVVASSAHAQVYNNGIDASETDTTWGSDHGISQYIGETFTLNATATFNQVRFLGTYSDNNPTTDIFVFNIFDTTAGVPHINPQPNSPIIVNDATRTDTGFDVLGLNLYEFTATFPSAITLNAGTYGISIVNNTELSPGFWGWGGQFIGGTAFIRGAESNPWGGLATEQSFSLINTQSSAAPEPDALALLLPVALGGLALRKARRPR